MSPQQVRLGVAGIGLVLLTSAYHRIHSPAVMADAAGRFLASLSAEQKAKAAFPFGDAQRLEWFFVPIERKGLPLREAMCDMRTCVGRLPSVGISQPT